MQKSTFTDPKLNKNNFNSVASGLKTAVGELRSNDTAAALATAAAAVKPLSAFGLRAFKIGSSLARRHPIQAVATVLTIGWLARKFLKAKPVAE